MTSNFNLIDERWIPCICADGSHDELSLRETLAQAHTLREIRGDTPLETAALHRLLLAILHRNFGPADRSAWRKLWQRRELGFDMQALDEYFAQWRYKFNLFDEQQPFFQFSDDTKLGIEDTVNKMVLPLTADSTLFEHTLNAEEGGAELTSAQAARILITVQNFALGYQLFVDGPCSKGAVFLVWGDSLYETLVLNLSKYPEDSGTYVSTEDDTPAWEWDSPFAIKVDGKLVSRDITYGENDGGKKKVRFDNFLPQGQLDRLTWHNRKLKLFKTETPAGTVVRRVRWAPGMRLDEAATDPMQVYVKNEGKGWFAIPFNTDKGLWRDSHVALRLADNPDRIRPIKAVQWLSNMARREPELLHRTLRLAAFGMAKDQAKVEFLRSELTPLPIEFLQNDDLVSALSVGVGLAEQIGIALQRVAFLMAWLVLTPNASSEKHDDFKKIDEKIAKGRADKSNDKEAQTIYKLYNSWNTDRAYWSRLEPHFHKLVMQLPQNSAAAQQTWRDQLRRAANAAFDYAESCAGNDLRAQRACAKARESFNFNLNRVLKVNDSNQLSAEEPAHE